MKFIQYLESIDIFAKLYQVNLSGQDRRGTLLGSILTLITIMTILGYGGYLLFKVSVHQCVL